MLSLRPYITGTSDSSYQSYSPANPPQTCTTVRDYSPSQMQDLTLVFVKSHTIFVLQVSRPSKISLWNAPPLQLSSFLTVWHHLQVWWVCVQACHPYSLRRHSTGLRGTLLIDQLRFWGTITLWAHTFNWCSVLPNMWSVLKQPQVSIPVLLDESNETFAFPSSTISFVASFTIASWHRDWATEPSHAAWGKVHIA